MATFKPTIRSKRSDGLCLVYIRCTQNRKVDYIKTDMYVQFKRVDNKGNITDNDILGKCAIKISEWNEKLNRENISNWSIQDVIKFTQQGNTNILFHPFCIEFIENMRKDNRGGTADNYQTALNNFISFFGENISFQEIYTNDLKKWMKTLKNKARAKEMYPICIRAMFNAGCDEYNEYDRNIIKIANQPFRGVDIPKADIPEKRSEDRDVIFKLLTVIPNTIRSKMAQDVAKLIVYLAGINTADLFYNEKKCEHKKKTFDSFDGEKLRYKRHKTTGLRKDKAYIEILVDNDIKYIFDLYKSDREKMFIWGYEYADRRSFNKNVNIGLKHLCELAGIEKITTYTFRHSWATIAQNKCGASTELVAFCLNHASAHKSAEDYIDKDFSPIDRMNKKVLDYIFQRGEYAPNKTKNTKKKKEAD